MIATPHFLYLHFPKAGGTFVTRHVRRAFPEASDFDKHGFRNQVPERYHHLPLVGCLRSPYDWYVSAYEFGWWRSCPRDFPGVVQHSRFPNLSFEDFVRLANRRWWQRFHADIGGRPRVGQYVVAMMTWFGCVPRRFLQHAIMHAPRADDLRRQLDGVRWLRTARLSADLADLLAECNVDEPKVMAVRDAPKLQPGPLKSYRRQPDWRPFYTPSLKRYVRYRDRLAFELFPEFDE